MRLCFLPYGTAIITLCICNVASAADFKQYISSSFQKISHTLLDIDYIYCKGPLRVFQYSGPNLHPTPFGCIKPDGTYGLYPKTCGDFEIVQFVGQKNFVIINHVGEDNVRNCIWDQQNYLNCKEKLPEAQSRLVANEVERELWDQIDSAEPTLLTGETIEVDSLFGVYTTTNTKIARKNDKIISPSAGPLGGLTIVCSNPGYPIILPNSVESPVGLGRNGVKFFRLARQKLEAQRQREAQQRQAAQRLQEEIM